MGIRLSIMTLAAMAVVGSATANAAIVNVSFSGTADNTFTSAPYRGTTFTGVFSLDTSKSPDLVSPPFAGGNVSYYYSSFLSSPITITSALGTVSSSPSAPTQGTLFHNVNNTGSLQFTTYTSASNEIDFRYFTSDSSFGSNGLPTAFPAPNAASNLYAAFGSGLTLYGTITSIAPGIGGSASAVPEPATWALMIGGFGMIGGTMRTRRRGVPVLA